MADKPIDRLIPGKRYRLLFGATTEQGTYTHVNRVHFDLIGTFKCWVTENPRNSRRRGAVFDFGTIWCGRGEHLWRMLTGIEETWDAATKLEEAEEPVLYGILPEENFERVFDA